MKWQSKPLYDSKSIALYWLSIITVGLTLILLAGGN